MAFGGGNIAGSKQLDPNHNNNKASATHLSSWTYSTAIPSTEIEVEVEVEVAPGCLGVSSKFQPRTSDSQGAGARSGRRGS
jgi:hypothetical protein